jgi:hypothetical protein
LTAPKSPVPGDLIQPAFEKLFLGGGIDQIRRAGLIEMTPLSLGESFLMLLGKLNLRTLFPLN